SGTTESDRAMHASGPINPQALPVTSGARITTPPSHLGYVYDLRRGNSCSDGFYATLPAFADQILTLIDYRAAPLIDGYTRHVTEFLTESPRSRGEYALEFLMLGMLLSRYECAAQNTPPWVVEVARELAVARERSFKAKPVVEWVRAGLARYSLAPRAGKSGKRYSAVERMARLADWLQSTGEFKEEARRLNNWQSYMAALSPQKATYWLRSSIELFQEFERQADRILGAYTRGVASFVNREHSRLRWREDLLMCGKPAVEYHLNMFAAEVMNRGLREDFARTAQKILLVPACMRGWHSGNCKANIDGVDISCTACDPECSVNRITRQMREHGIAVYIVPHSTGFSRWLARWQHTGAGVTAVACALNILPGGFEMRERGIAAQCLPLDFPGCRKHWDANGFPTGVNEARLVQIATADANLNSKSTSESPLFVQAQQSKE
ncbi:MAG: DUF116 domain-containing protein, partial [Terracidiphilus sp.]